MDLYVAQSEKYCDFRIMSYPFEYKGKVSDLRATELFMDDRVVPDTRQGILPELERIGIKYYDPEALIRYNKGVSIEDHYWIDVE